MANRKLAINFLTILSIIGIFMLPIQSRAFFIAPFTSITIVVHTAQSESVFDFTASAQYFEPNLPANFSISTVNFTGQENFSVNSFNSYNFAEQVPAGWQLDNISCVTDNPDTRFYVDRNFLGIVPAGFENVVCSFNNSPVAASLISVLFIPGILGTEMKKGSDTLWLDVNRLLSTNNDRFMDPLAFKIDGTPLDNSVELGKVLKEPDPSFNYTKGLIEDFQSQNYQENKDLFLFSYDWRDDIIKNADTYLKQKIDEIASSTGASKLDIVAHSQGGLLIKRLFYDHPEYQNKIRKLVFLGTPHLGAPKAAKALLYGDSMGVQWSVLGLDPAEIKRIGHDMPAVYQMLPSRQYFSHSSGYWGTLEVPWFSDPKITLYDYQITKDKLKADGYNSTLLDSAEVFHAPAYDNFDFSNTGIEAYNILGCESPTIYRMLVRKSGADKLEYGPGDGTVPVFSASNILGARNFYVLKKDDLHGKMPSFAGIRQKVVNLIAGRSLPTDNVTSNPTECQFDGRTVSIHSPVDLHIYDEFNNHVGPLDDGNMEFGIPGVAYDVIDHQKFAFLPRGHAYKLKLLATDIGSFSFDSSIIEQAQTINTTHYDSVPITPSSTAEIILNATNNQSIQLDTNGDGINDATISPSSILDANQSQDLIPPVSTSTLAGIMGQPGFYRSDVAISLAAEDPIIFGQEDQTSGVLNIVYQLDNTGPYVAYQSPVSVSAEGPHSIKFFSTDNAGNSESAQTVNFTIDKQAPELRISFEPQNRDLQFAGLDNLSAASAISIIDSQGSVMATDEAGNAVKITFEEKDRKTALKAGVLSLFYNGSPMDINHTRFKFQWEWDRQGNLKKLEQIIKSKKDFEIEAIYKPREIKIKGKDQSGKINLTQPGLVLLKVFTNQGDFEWGY